jgi:hypothetical protein
MQHPERALSAVPRGERELLRGETSIVAQVHIQIEL